ncbi:MAG: arsenate reductase ArsC [Actinomycetota bacterium]
MNLNENGDFTTEQIVMIRQSAERLRRHFDGTFNAETIERYMRSSRDILLPNATITTWLPLLIERVTRDRLRAIARLETTQPVKPAVLFLCVHNAGRSQMAAGWLRHLAGGNVDVFSGGTDPGDALNDTVVNAMADVGIDITGELPQPWTDEVVRTVDVIVSMGCGDACPIYPGKRYEDWDLPSPSHQPLDVVREIRDDVRTRVEALLASLDVATTTAN